MFLFLKQLVHIRLAGAVLVMAQIVIVGQRVGEEQGAVGTFLAGAVAVPVTHEAGHGGNMGGHAEADRHTFLGQRPIVIGDPPLGLLGTDKGEGQGANAFARCGQNGVAP